MSARQDRHVQHRIRPLEQTELEDRDRCQGSPQCQATASHLVRYVVVGSAARPHPKHVERRVCVYHAHLICDEHRIPYAARRRQGVN